MQFQGLWLGIEHGSTSLGRLTEGDLSCNFNLEYQTEIKNSANFVSKQF